MHVGDAAEGVRPLVLLACIGVDVIGDELLPHGEHFDLLLVGLAVDLLRVCRVEEPSAVALGPTTVLRTVDKEDARGRTDALGCVTHVLTAPCQHAVADTRVADVDVDGNDGVLATAADHASAAAGVVAQIAQPKIAVLPTGQGGSFLTGLDGNDRIAVGDQAWAKVDEVVVVGGCQTLSPLGVPSPCESCSPLIEHIVASVRTVTMGRAPAVSSCNQRVASSMATALAAPGLGRSQVAIR